MSNAKRFPIDCEKECPYHKARDLSIDDWTHFCTKLGVQIDEMDAYAPWAVLPLCPLPKEKEE